MISYTQCSLATSRFTNRGFTTSRHPPAILLFLFFVKCSILRKAMGPISCFLIGKRSSKSNFPSQCSLRLTENSQLLVVLRHYRQKPKYKRSIATSRKFTYRARSRDASAAMREHCTVIRN